FFGENPCNRIFGSLESTINFLTEPQDRTIWERSAETARQGESDAGRPGPPSLLRWPAPCGDGAAAQHFAANGRSPGGSVRAWLHQQIQDATPKGEKKSKKVWRDLARNFAQ